jgi:predicted transcriptional regulator
MHEERYLKTTTIPPLRVSPELRQQAESVLEEGETLSSFMLDALRHSIDLRQSQQAFVARGLASAAKAKATGKYIPADRVIAKLTRRLSAAKRRAA